MVQVRISSEGGDHTFNVDVPFTREKIRELIRGRTNIPEESQSLFDYSEKRETEFELIGTRVFVANIPQHFVLKLGMLVNGRIFTSFCSHLQMALDSCTR